MANQPDKFPKEPAEGDRDVINNELERQQKKQAAHEPPRPDPAKGKEKDRY